MNDANVVGFDVSDELAEEADVGAVGNVIKPVIYYRRCNDLQDNELAAMQRYFRCVESRMSIEQDELCIARYSALPYYRELETDIIFVGAKMINTHKQHRWIADLGNWTADLGDLTPQTWHRLDFVPDCAFPIIVKGETNSKKFQWDTHMFAKDRRTAVDVMCRLQDDGFLCDQQIYFRKYVRLHSYLTGFRNLPITKEFRVFVCDGVVLSRGYYWSNYVDDIETTPDANEIPDLFLQRVIDCIGKNARYYTIDVAQTQSGDWIVIELNDGQMSGLSENDPEELYKNLKKVLT